MNQLLPRVFSYAFRPFFLLVAGYALIAIAAWGLYLTGAIGGPGDPSPRLRHGHEMIFGFGGGAVAGFLLTAVATWTGRQPVAGGRLVALSGCWLGARFSAVLPGLPGLMLWGGFSLAFWIGLAGLLARELLASGNRRNYKVIVLLAGFLSAEAVFFLRLDHAGWAEAGLRAGLFLLLGMISLVGGRIIPAFSQNWLRVHRPELNVSLPSFGSVDLAAVGLMAGFGLGLVVWPAAPATGWAAVLAGAAQLARLWRWCGWLTWREPLLWVLHVGYAWIPVGFGILGVAILTGRPWFDSGLHALAYGAIGTMILGVAARVALGHTGRPLQATAIMTAAFVALTFGAVARVAGGGGGLALAVGCWLLAFALFLVRYVPILLSPRVDT